jgi:hypothetical protein
MKCIPECGFAQKPDNLPKLTRHLEDCLFTGPCSTLKTEPFIIWKDGEFTISKKKTKKDMVFEVNLIRKVAVELKDNQIKTPADYVNRVDVNQGPASNTIQASGPKIIADIPEEFKK